MRWFLKEVEWKRASEILLRDAGGVTRNYEVRIMKSEE
jgi:hypothetical protein